MDRCNTTLHNKGYESLAHKTFDLPLQLKPDKKETMVQTPKSNLKPELA